jgi:PelA/Pel-15E family pectate lyase
VGCPLIFRRSFQIHLSLPVSPDIFRERGNLFHSVNILPVSDRDLRPVSRDIGCAASIYNNPIFSLNNKHTIMKFCKTLLNLFLIVSILSADAVAQKKDLTADVKKTMLDATRYMVDKVSVNGGYVRIYLPDLSRRWGELEFYKTQVQVQSPGLTSMGNVFLDAYQATGDEYYYHAAEGTAQGLILGQMPCGGWNYMIDFAGDRSLKEWYNTIGKNAWGFEEYYHYYGNATFDDVNTSDAAKFLLRLYLEKLDINLKPALDKVIALLLKSQYPLGGWPQRYPLKYDFPHGKETDYTSFATFNDNAIWGNIEFLIQCYATLGEERLLDPILRGMNFYLITQQGNPQGGWGQQYNMQVMPDHARSYEPASLCTGQTYDHVLRLLQFYQLTGDRKFLARVPDAIQWLESTRLPANLTNGGARTHPLFVEIGTNRPLWPHRTGSGVNDQHYWVDYDTTKPYAYGDNTVLNIDYLRQEYKRISSLSPEEASENSPLKVTVFTDNRTPQQYYRETWPAANDADVARTRHYTSQKAVTDEEVKQMIKSLDDQNRWLSRHEWISNPYSVSADGKVSNTAMRADEIHGNWIMDSTEQKYISVSVYQKNMEQLISYLGSRKN